MTGKRKHICCNHVYNRQRDVLLVIRTQRSFQLMCGGSHGEEDKPALIEEDRLIEMDTSLSTIWGLKINHSIEREYKNGVWSLKYYYNELDPKTIKSNNDHFIADRWGVNFDYLPEIDLRGFKVRSTEEVKSRALILSLIVRVSFSRMLAGEAIQHLKKYNLYDQLTTKEREFLDQPDEEARANETWKSECLYTLLWSLGIEVDLDEVVELGDLDLFEEDDFPFSTLNSSPDHFLNNSKLKIRDEEDLVTAFDYFSRMDYICDWNSINNRKLTINSALVYERRYALTWLLYDIHWDRIVCDSLL